MENKKHDPVNYRRVSEPFATVEEANKALSEFLEAVEEARNRLRIMDVHVIVKINVVDGAGMTDAHFGNSLECAPMCAWALGQAQAEFENTLRGYLKASPKVGE